MVTLKQKLDAIKYHSEYQRYLTEAMKYEYYSGLKSLIITLTAFCFGILAITIITLNLALK